MITLQTHLLQQVDALEDELAQSQGSQASFEAKRNSVQEKLD